MIELIRFGTGGWRAIIAEDFTFSNVRKVARGLASMSLRKSPEPTPIVVGYDMRFMSREFAEVFAAELASEGIKVWFLMDPSPTPQVMCAVDKEGLDFGVAVTASHNPPKYNGIKVIVSGGKDAPVEVTNELEGVINALPSGASSEGSRTPSFAQLLASGAITPYSNRNDYIDSLLAQVDVESIRKHNLRVLFNPMYGTAKDIMNVCLASLRCSVDTINSAPNMVDTKRAPSPDKIALGDMEFLMHGGGYDLGIATDGDSDRLGLYDETGCYVDANQMLRLLYYYLKEYRGRRGGIVRNLTTTHVLDKIAAAYNEPAFEVPVGFKYISAAMDEHDLLLGGESSGGLKIRGHVNGKDGILAALLCVEMLTLTGKTLSQLDAEICERFGRTLFHTVNIPLDEATEQRLRSQLFDSRYVPAFPKHVARVSYMDGVKFYFDDDTWTCIRFSGTEPLLRIVSEMTNEQELHALLNGLGEDPVLQLR